MPIQVTPFSLTSSFVIIPSLELRGSQLVQISVLHVKDPQKRKESALRGIPFLDPKERNASATSFTPAAPTHRHISLPFSRDIARLQEQAKRKAAENGDDDDERYQDPDNETGLFNAAPYEADDAEADQIYDAIDAKLSERTKARR